VGLRLRRHGVRPVDRLVLYDGGDLVAAASAAQAAELAGHPQVAVLAGGLAAWDGELVKGPVELERSREEYTPRLEAMPTRDEIRDRLGDPGVTIVDVRRDDEYSGRGGYPCDPRQGHIPGARHLEVGRLYAEPGRPLPADEIRALVGDADEIIVYCHSGSRSALGALALRSAGYRVRNYVGSWHEWSRHVELPVEK
jgi:thiosulfate/3-mercaptopyruvate sulfurtransferase